MLITESIYPFLNEDFLVREILNERIDFNSIKDKAKKIGILASLFLLTASNKGLKDLPSKQELVNSKPLIHLAQQPYVSKDDVQEKFDQLFDFYFWKDEGTKLNYDILQNPLTLKTSNDGLNFIRNHEKLRLEAYKIGDGKITIGWGHAEPANASQYVVGQKISEYEAEILFRKDLKKAEEGVKRLFEKWVRQGLNIKISQHMWDSMVSMAYNMGINGLRGSDMIQSLKQGDYLTAADSILITKTNPIKFPGLEERREKEKELFLKGLLVSTLS
jgi:GH24 family phage-related lysozyme (muramidase)